MNSLLMSRGRLALAMVASFCLIGALISAATAAQAVLQPGEPAPPIALKTTKGKTYRLDTSTTSPTLILFVKPADRYTSNAIQALDHLFDTRPELAKGLERWIVASRLGATADPLAIEKIANERWPVLLDTDDRVYAKYRIIATPTVVLITPDRMVAAINPGYDYGMESHLRKELAKLLGVEVREEVKAYVASESSSAMTVQMGRRLASRGLYERAISYYEKFAEEGSLSPEIRMEMAEVYGEIGARDKTVEVLQPLMSNPEWAAKAKDLIAKLEKANKAGVEPRPRTPGAPAAPRPGS